VGRKKRPEAFHSLNVQNGGGGMLEEYCLLLCPVDGTVKEVSTRYGGAGLPHLAPINYIL
jgi:hypothetical protein